jgi:AbrB family looped-hinge helix DNA binding protein
MQTRVSTKGQVVLPSPIRHQLGLRPGDSLEAALEGGRIVLTPRRLRPRKVKILVDPATGLAVLSVAGDAPLLTNKQVKEILATFP